MTPGARKFALTAHITSSVGWLGAAASFEGLAVAGLASQNDLTARAAYLVMEWTAWFVILPFAFTSLVTGLVVSLGTKWGLFRHYWILAKFLINAIAIVFLLVHTRLIGFVASAAAANTLLPADLRDRFYYSGDTEIDSRRDAEFGVKLDLRPGYEGRQFRGGEPLQLLRRRQLMSKPLLQVLNKGPPLLRKPFRAPLRAPYWK